MGGAVLVGIRRRNGEEYIAERWTNNTPFWFNDPAMYDEDEVVVQRYINMARDEDDVVRDPKIITPSEYGVILVDLVKRRVISRQNYTLIGGVHTNFADIEKMSVVQALHNRNLITKVRAFIPKDEEPVWTGSLEGSFLTLDEPSKEHYFKLLQEMIVTVRDWEERGERFDHPAYQLEDKRLNNFLEVFWEIPGLEVSDSKGRKAGCNHWPEIMKWVADNGWKTPIMPMAEVVKEYELELPN